MAPILGIPNEYSLPEMLRQSVNKKQGSNIVSTHATI